MPSEVSYELKIYVTYEYGGNFVKQSTQDILTQIKAESERRKHLTEIELREQYNQLELGGFSTNQRIKFIADLSESNQFTYHYELICKDWGSNRAKQLY